MGITRVTWDSMSTIDFIGSRVAELGDQKLFFKEPLIVGNIEIVYFKNYCDLFNIPHVSIDWHGENGTLKLDFTKDIPYSMVGQYSICTNFGFTEHVTDQYTAWKNCDKLVRVGGLIVSELPGEANFPSHETLPYYTLEYFSKLAQLYKYEIIELRYQIHDYPSAGQVVWCILKKTNNDKYISRDEYDSIWTMGRGSSE